MDNNTKQIHQDIENLSLDDPLAQIRPGYRPRDITDAFTRSCRDLSTGELIQHEGFKLWDTVPALEIMDSKMDSGCYEPGEDPANGFDVSRNLLPAEIIWIMDEILCRELAWLRGFAYFQTVFTSVHIHHLLVEHNKTKLWPRFAAEDELRDERQPKYTHTCLLAFCLATIIQCDMNHELVVSQVYYEEEDLTTHTCGLNLCSTLSDEDCLTRLDDAIDWLQTRMTGGMSIEEWAICQRLQLRRTLMILFMYNQNDMGLESLPVQLREIYESHDLGERLQDAFDSKAYHKLAIGGPTREPAVLSFEEAVMDLYDLHHQFQEGNRVGELGPEPNAEVVRIFLWNFASMSPAPSVLARAKLQAQLYSQGNIFAPGNISRMHVEMFELNAVDEDILNFDAGRESSPESEAFRRSYTAAMFMENAFETVADSYRALCQNRCRIRRSLINSQENLNHVLTEFRDSNVSDLSEDVRTHIINCYLEVHMARQAMWIILLGFDHEVYETFELGLMYRMVKILSSEIHTLNKKDLSGFKPPTAPLNYRLANLRELAVMANLAAGLAHLYAALSRLGALPSPVWLPETSLQRMWDIRLYQLRNNPRLAPRAIQHFDTFRFQHLYQYGRDLKNVREMLECAEIELAFAAEAYAKPIYRNEAARAMFGLPLEHWLVQKWFDEIHQQRRVVVQAKVEIHKLKSVVMEADKGDITNDRLKPGCSVSVQIPTTAQRLQKDKKGNTVGHAWFVVPNITVRESESPLETVD